MTAVRWGGAGLGIDRGEICQEGGESPLATARRTHSPLKDRGADYQRLVAFRVLRRSEFEPDGRSSQVEGNGIAGYFDADRRRDL